MEAALVGEAGERILGRLAFQALHEPRVRERDRGVRGVGRQGGDVSRHEHRRPVGEGRKHAEWLVAEDQGSGAHRAKRQIRMLGESRQGSEGAQVVDDDGSTAQLAGRPHRPGLQRSQGLARNP